MRKKILSAVPALFVAGATTVRLSAADVQAEIDVMVPVRYEGVEISSVQLEFLPDTGGVQASFRGSFSGMVNMIPYRCGFGFAAVGTIEYNRDKAALYFNPTSFGNISLAPGEGMPVVEPVIGLATSAGGAVVDGALSGAKSIGGAVGRAARAVTGRIVPKFLRRAGSAVAGKVGSGVGVVTGKVGDGIGVVQEFVQGLVIKAARAFLERTPVYKFRDDAQGREARSLVDDIKVEQGQLVITLSTSRHAGLRSWRTIVGVGLLTAAVLGTIAFVVLV